MVCLEGLKESKINYSQNSLYLGSVIIITTIIFINCNSVITRWQWLFYMYTNRGEKKVTRKFNSGELHGRHVVATWELGNHLSIRL